MAEAISEVDLSKTARLLRWVVPVLLLLPVIFICGKVLLTPVSVEEDFADYYTRVERHGLDPFEMGWPWSYAMIYANPIDNTEAPYWFDFGVDPSRWPLLIVDLLVMATIVCYTAWAVKRLWKSSGCGRRFSLRTLFILVGVVCAGLGWWAYNRFQFNREIQAANRIGAIPYIPHQLERIEGDMQLSGFDHWVIDFTYCGPEWLHRLLPEKCLNIFCRAMKAQAGIGSAGDDRWEGICAAIDGMPSLHILNLDAIRPLPSTIDPKTFRNIDTISLLPPEGVMTKDALSTADEPFISTLAKLPKLRRIFIRPQDSTMNSVVKLAQLECIMIDCDAISDKGMLRLLEMPNLKKIIILSRGNIAEKTFQTIRMRIPLIFNFPQVGWFSRCQTSFG